MLKKNRARAKKTRPARKAARAVTLSMELSLQANAERIGELRRIRFPSHDGRVGRPRKVLDFFGAT